MATDSSVLVYVTSHGFGHLNRAAAIVESLPPTVRVVVKTNPDQILSWRAAVRRECELLEGVFDCGTVHPAGESSLVDPAATLEQYQQIHSAARARFDHEVAFVRRGGFSAVVSDIASLPLQVACAAGVPSVLVANFTWHDIFAPYVRRLGSRFSAMLDEMQREYACADVLVRAQPAIESRAFSRVHDVGLVTRRGRNRRRELLDLLGLARHARLVYMYVGRYGQHDMAWKNLARLTEFDFVSFHPIGAAAPNWHVVDPTRWPARDLAASVHVMVAKAGYGTVTDAMTHRTPLVFPPRFGFAEHRVLAASLRRWGGGVPIQTRDFKELRLRSFIEKACALEPAASPWPTDGARRCASVIMRLTAGRRKR